MRTEQRNVNTTCNAEIAKRVDRVNPLEPPPGDNSPETLTITLILSLTMTLNLTLAINSNRNFKLGQCL